MKTELVGVVRGKLVENSQTLNFGPNDWDGGGEGWIVFNNNSLN